MNQAKDRIRDLLSRELCSYRYKKVDLAKIFGSVLGVEGFGKKQDLAEGVAEAITKKFSEQMVKLVAKGYSKIELKERSYKMVEGILARYNLKDFNYGYVLRINDLLISEATEPVTLMSNPRQLRPTQETVNNIWDESGQRFTECLCTKSGVEPEKKTEQCYRCGQQYHFDCFWPREKEEISECPFCFIRFCFPHREAKRIIFAGYLPVLKKQKVEYKINFSLDSRMKTDKTLHLEARCVKFNSKNRYELSWPDNGAFYLGRMKLGDFKPLQTNSPLKRRSDQPIKLDRSRLQLENEIIIQERNTSQVMFRTNKKCYHLVVLMYVQDLSKEAVMAKLNKNYIKIQQSKAIIKESLGHQSQDLTLQKISISLKCQFFGSRIRLPVRSKLCSTHYQPFDLVNFVNSSILAKTSTRKWKCPICDKRAYDVVVDRYILELLQKDQKAGQIVFKKNAEPEMHQEENSFDDEIDSPIIQAQPQSKPALINLDSEPDQEKSQQDEISVDSGRKRQRNQSTLKPLTSQDSEREIYDSNVVRKLLKKNNGTQKSTSKKNASTVEVFQISSDQQQQSQGSQYQEAFSKKTPRKDKMAGQDERKKILKQKKMKDFHEIEERINQYTKIQKSGQKNCNKIRLAPCIPLVTKEIQVIEVESDSESEMSLNLKEELRKLQRLRIGLERQGKPYITEEDTEIFETLFKKVMDRDPRE